MRHEWGVVHPTLQGPVMYCGRCLLRVRWRTGPRRGLIREAAPANVQGYQLARTLPGCPGAVPS